MSPKPDETGGLYRTRIPAHHQEPDRIVAVVGRRYHGWLRVLGGGHGQPPDVVTATESSAGRLIVGYDVLGEKVANTAG